MAGGAVDAAVMRDWVVAFYAEHNPEKLQSVDFILSKFAGKENELVRQLEEKYAKPPANLLDDGPAVERADGGGGECDDGARSGGAEAHAAPARVAEDVDALRRALALSEDKWRRERDARHALVHDKARLQSQLSDAAARGDRERARADDAQKRARDLADADRVCRGAARQADLHTRRLDGRCAALAADGAVAHLATRAKHRLLCNALDAQAELRAHLDATVEALARHAPADDALPPTAARQPVDADDAAAVAAHADATFESLFKSAREQLRLLLRERSQTEARVSELFRAAASAGDEVRDLRARLCEATALAEARQFAEERSSADLDVAALCRDRLATELLRTAEAHAATHAQLASATNAASITAETRREVDRFYRDERGRCERACDALVAAAEDRAAMLREDALGRELDLVASHGAAADARVASARDDVRRVSEVLVDVQRQQTAADVENRRLRRELQRAADALQAG
ncbi:hypothetical protein M885DRAFT_528078 [Pelagophyceae sp. CCMP2097]|nr:hypothetical protein M885DRAFT_528078 [Pelagophyceae sp. CCMP2097]